MLVSHWLFWLKNFSKNSCKGFIVSLRQHIFFFLYKIQLGLKIWCIMISKIIYSNFNVYFPNYFHLVNTPFTKFCCKSSFSQILFIPNKGIWWFFRLPGKTKQTFTRNIVKITVILLFYVFTSKTLNLRI